MAVTIRVPQRIPTWTFMVGRRRVVRGFNRAFAAAQTRHFVEWKNTAAFDFPVFPQSHFQWTVRHGWDGVDGSMPVATRDPARCPTATIARAPMA
jgi:hypothetical protein